MRRPSRRTSRVLGFTVVPVSLVATGLFVTASSYSVFSSSVTTPGNSWQAASISLTDDSSASAAFTVTGAYPSSASPVTNRTTGSRCITVTYTGTVPVSVKMYAANPSNTAGGQAGAVAPATDIDVTITTGTGGTNSGGGCTGFTAGGATGNVYSGTLLTYQGKTTYALPASSYTWSPSSNGSLVYKIDWTFRDNGAPSSATTGDNRYQGGSAGVDFVWEAQNS